MLKVEGFDGQMVESKVALKDLVGALQYAAQNRIGPFGNGAAAAAAPGAAHAAAPAASRTAARASTGGAAHLQQQQPTAGPAVVNQDVAEEARRRALQEMYDKGKEIYAEREQKTLEAVRISSKLQELKDKRAARAAKRWKREQRRRGLLSTDNSVMPKSQPVTSQPVFAGLRKGFLL